MNLINTLMALAKHMFQKLPEGVWIYPFKFQDNFLLNLTKKSLLQKKR